MRARPPDPRARILARRATRNLTSPPVAEKTRPWWLEHLGLILSAALFVMLTFRVLAISDYDPTTAKAVVQNGATASMAIAIAVASARVAAMAVLYVLTGYFALAAYERDMGPVGIQWAIFVIPVIFLVPWWGLVGAAVLIGGAWLVGFFVPPPDSRPRRTVIGLPADRVFLWLLAVMALSFVSGSDSWLPAERIEVKGHDTFTGYVLGERDGGDLVILDKTGGTGVQAFPLDAVTRSYCEEASGVFFATILTVFRDSTYPACPDD